MNNSFVSQFSENIKFHYTSFNRVIIRGYIRSFFSLGVVVQFSLVASIMASHPRIGDIGSVLPGLRWPLNLPFE